MSDNGCYRRFADHPLQPNDLDDVALDPLHLEEVVCASQNDALRPRIANLIALVPTWDPFDPGLKRSSGSWFRFSGLVYGTARFMWGIVPHASPLLWKTTRLSC